jgi:hypothetical protein
MRVGDATCRGIHAIYVVVNRPPDVEGSSEAGFVAIMFAELSVD